MMGIKHVTEDKLFESLGFGKKESAALTMKAKLYIAIHKQVDKKGLTRKQLERIWDIPQPRVSQIMTGKIEKISIEKLLGYLELLDMRIDVKVSPQKRAS